MDRYDLTSLSDDAVDLEWDRSVEHDRASTADMLARLAEYDARQLYRRAGYASMYAYCVGAKNFCENEARRRIHAARTARRFPGLYAALADGRLHVTAIVMLAPHLNPDNFDELVGACTCRTAAQIQEILDRRVVRLETIMEGASHDRSLAPPEKSCPTEDVALIDPLRALKRVQPEPLNDAQPLSLSTIPTPTASQTPRPEPSFSVTLERSAQETLEYARTLLSHQMPLASASQVIERALKELIAREEKKKFAATERPRAPRASRRTRYIPAHVKRAVWKRDQGRCTFVGKNGDGKEHRCDSREFLEYDHVEPVARGGKTSVDGVRLRCRTHNQYEAEQAFGADFMRRKREAGRRRSTFTSDRKRAPG